MIQLDEPVFCLTTDTDWASEFALARLFGLFRGWNVRPTVFATHPSAVLDAADADGACEIGIHPNFFPGSSHGNSVGEVLDHMQAMYPRAKTIRSHAGLDSSRISIELYRRGFRYDSNELVYFQPQITPRRHGSGITRFPIFWEEDVHWYNQGPDWDLERYWPYFLTPGVKVLNVHAFMIVTNCPDQDYYESVKSHITTLDEESLPRVRYPKRGAGDFFRELMDRLVARGTCFYLLSELFRMLPIERFMPEGADVLARPPLGPWGRPAR